MVCRNGKTWIEARDKTNVKKHLRKYMSYAAASMTIRGENDRGENISSRLKYLRWHDRVKPVAIPKRPDRVYPDWTTWGDFLGVYNSWDGYDRQARYSSGVAWRPYWESVRYVQKLGLKTKLEWHAYVAETGLPDDIPKAPDNTYRDEWTGWNAWLGKDIMSRVESADKVVGIIGLCYNSCMPRNVIELVVAKEGLMDMQARLGAKPHLEIFKAYRCNDGDMLTEFMEDMQLFASKQDDSGMYLVPNMMNLLFELDTKYVQYRS